MVGKTGFEPATPWSQTKCSTKLSHFPKNNSIKPYTTQYTKLKNLYSI